jgi:hypothetical protein
MVREFDSGLSDECRTFAVSGDLAVLADRFAFAVVDVGSGSVARYPHDYPYGPKAITVLADRRMLVASIEELHVYALSEFYASSIRSWPYKSTGTVIGLASAGERFAIGVGDQLLTGWTDRDQLTAVDSPTCEAVALSADGSLVAAARGDTVGVYGTDALDLRAEFAIAALEAQVIATGITPDGTLVAAGDDYTQTAVFEPATGVRLPTDSVGKAVSLSWNVDGSLLLLVGLRLLAVSERSGAPRSGLRDADLGRYYLLGGGWTADGSHVVIGTEHGKVQLWQLSD